MAEWPRPARQKCRSLPVHGMPQILPVAHKAGEMGARPKQSSDVSRRTLRHFRILRRSLFRARENPRCLSYVSSLFCFFTAFIPIPETKTAVSPHQQAKLAGKETLDRSGIRKTKYSIPRYICDHGKLSRGEWSVFPRKWNFSLLVTEALAIVVSYN